MTGSERIVVLIDMDCFYCQVEEKLNPDLKGKPIAVVQYNQWQGGGIIAVNYLARAKGVTRHMRGDEAKNKCAEIELPSVPCVRGKADISKYRKAGKDVAVVLQEYTTLLERASVDEAYLDITQVVAQKIENYKLQNSINKNDLQNTFILGYDDIDRFACDIYEKNDIDCEMEGFDKSHSRNLLVGAIVVSEIRKAVYEKTGFQCSAGIAHNKIMAKLACGLNKPNKQTILPKNSIPALFQSLPVSKIRHLGGKFGEAICKTLNITNMIELTHFSEKELQKKFDEKNGSWLYNIARGIDNEPVMPRFNSKSIGCCKKFPGKTAIMDVATLTHWLKELASEIQDRLKDDSQENNRYPTQMVASFAKFINGKDASCSRSVNLSKDEIFCAETLATNALSLIKKDSNPFCLPEHENSDSEQKMILTNPIKFLGISVGKFENLESKKGIQHFFGQSKPNNQHKSHTTEELEIAESISNIPIETRNPEKKGIRHFFEQSKPNNQHIPHITEELEIAESISNIPTETRTPEKKGIRHFFGQSKPNNQHIPHITEELEIAKSISNIPIETRTPEKAKLSTTLDKTSVQNSFFIKYMKKFTTPTKVNPEDTENSKETPENSKQPVEPALSECTVDNMISSETLKIDEDTNDSIEPQRNTFSISKFFNSGKRDLLSDDDSNQYIDITNKIQCDKCDARLDPSELQTHQDYHFALALKEDERREVKNTRTITINQNKQPQKKRKVESKAESNSIIKLFNKISSKNDEIVEDGNGNVCEECGKTINPSKFQEHLDHHEARKLHNELNKPNMIEVPKVNITPKKNTSSKTTLKNKEKIKLISTFFQSENC